MPLICARRKFFIGKLTPLCTALLILAGCVSTPPPVAPSNSALRLTQIAFSDLRGWKDADLDAGLTAFLRSCARTLEQKSDLPLGVAGFAGTPADWRDVCESAQSVGHDRKEIRAFFERAFIPYRVAQGADENGLFTGYYEPLLRGSLTRHDAFQTPLYGVPTDLVSVDLGLFRDNLKGQRLAGRMENGRLVPYATRAEIVRNGLPTTPTLLFVDDPVDAFFLAVQGSGRVTLDDGDIVRLVYAAQNGHPYTAIGAVLVADGELKREDVTMSGIRAWLKAHPEKAESVLDRNASYVFFAVQPLGDPRSGARGTGGVPLSADASLAVDATLYPMGLPLWVETSVPIETGLNRPLDTLMVAQDTGGAIKGAVRGDVYFGVGEEVGAIAGRMKSPGRFAVFLPKNVAARLGRDFVAGAP